MPYRRQHVCFSAPLTGLLAGAIALFLSPPLEAQQTGFEALEDVDYWRDLCRLQATADAYEAALTACEQALTLAPEEADIWARHSGILVNLEAYP
ncbi:MAG: hypothetical protein AAFZ80_11835, partial [Cyanobacteria bacterium P01_A01_bin.105]